MFPIYKKELQSFFYTPFAYAMAALFMLLFTLPLASAISHLENSNTLPFSFTEMFYSVILYFIFLLPILTMRTFADERKNGTEVLLMTSPVSVAKIVIAKHALHPIESAFIKGAQPSKTHCLVPKSRVL